MNIMSAFLHMTVRVLMTPADLRQIADEMERIRREGKVGSSAVAKTWVGDGVDVLFVLDEQRASVPRPPQAASS